MAKQKCNECGRKPISVKKWALCSRCYQRMLRAGMLSSKPSYNMHTKREPIHEREQVFAELYFDNEKEFIYEPITFHIIGHGRYTPDFIDLRDGTLIEVVGTRQALNSNLNKIKKFIKLYGSFFKYEIRYFNGNLIDIDIFAKLTPTRQNIYMKKIKKIS
jgi:hypothetical protein